MDEMGELLSLDDSIFVTRKILEEQEELRYLTELVYQDIAATEYYDECDAQWDTRSADIYPSPTSIWEDSLNELRREQLLYQDEISQQNFNRSMRTPEVNIAEVERFIQLTQEEIWGSLHQQQNR